MKRSNSVQNIGDVLPPSDSGINLPEHRRHHHNPEGQHHRASARLFRVDVRGNEGLPGGRQARRARSRTACCRSAAGTPAMPLFKYWKETAIRISESERRNFYARTLGIRRRRRRRHAEPRLQRPVAALSSRRSPRSSGRTRWTTCCARGYPAPSASSRCARPRATWPPISRCTATAWPTSRPRNLQKQVNYMIKLLPHPEIMGRLRRAGHVAGDRPGGALPTWAVPRNSLRYRTLATCGTIITAWLANNVGVNFRRPFGPILDIDEFAIRRSPQRRKATTEPDRLRPGQRLRAVAGRHGVRGRDDRGLLAAQGIADDDVASRSRSRDRARTCSSRRACRPWVSASAPTAYAESTATR